MRHPLVLAGIATLFGCSEADLPGSYFDVDLQMVSDECNAQAVGYSESLTYRVTDVPDDDQMLSVSVGPDEFARGPSEGCSFTYSSVAWTEPREAGDLRWTLSGTAAVQRGDGSCGNPSDWQGTEVFTILSSEDPAINPGCTYTVDVTGTFVGEVE